MINAPTTPMIAFLSHKTAAVSTGSSVDQSSMQGPVAPVSRDAPAPVSQPSRNEPEPAASPSRNSSPDGTAPKTASTNSRAPRTASHPAGSSHAKPVIVPTATLDLAVQHQFKEATLSIWIDNHLVLTRSLHGGAQKRLVVFSGVRGVDSESIQVPAGAHTVRLRAQTPDKSIDISKTVSAEFVGGGVKNLHVTFDRHNSAMHLDWQ